MVSRPAPGTPDAAASEAAHIREDLAVLRVAVRYRRWLGSELGRRCGPTVLEVGAGDGEVGLAVREYGRRVIASDIDPDALATLRERYGDDSMRIDLTVEPDPALAGRFDTVLHANVIEHLDDDASALVGMARCVRPGGTIVGFVPSTPWAYGAHDAAIGHRRRYTKPTLAAAHARAGLAVEEIRAFNIVGLFGWWFTGRVRGRVELPGASVAGFDRLVVPWLSALERRVAPPIGQSLICVARVPGA